MLSRHSVGTCQGNKSTHSLSSQLAEPPKTHPGLKIGTGIHELISMLKKCACGE